MNEIAPRLQEVRERIAAAAERAGRAPDEVRLVAVAKTFPVDVVAAAADAGATDIGENRAQELKEKHALLGDRVIWHFVGHLQTNKVKLVVGAAALIHSVDRYGLAEAIARRATSLGITQDVLIEVNVAGEATKQGVEPSRAQALALEVAGLDGVAVRGVMGMPPPARDPSETRRYFRELAEIGRQIEGATELSMGMSGDFEVAVEEGSTLVRVGEAIFGPRIGRPLT
jgi:pyridoxal phosphate enzyme (YggS family)